MVINLLSTLLDIYLYMIIASVIISWMVAFDVINRRNKWVRQGLDLLDRFVEPPMTQLRRLIPPLGGIDITPMAMVLIIYLLQGLLQGMRG